MITNLIYLLIIGLVLLVIFYVVSMFIGGMILKVVGAILALVFLLYALNYLGMLPPGGPRT